MKKIITKKLSSDNINFFQTMIWDYYHSFGRSFAWRNTHDPYKIVISEVMLQQTQTYRVISKYEQFIEAFPNFYELAHASLRDVLSVWQGLGYNRRGKYLHELAKHVVTDYNGTLPSNPDRLIMLPGIGSATASSITAFAFNLPAIFIETNIRSVFIHSFFPARKKIDDKEIIALVAQTLDKNNPRQWYYALMDYGVMLKQTHPNPNRKSKHYTKQSKFDGSDRQIRGAIIRFLTDEKELSLSNLYQTIDDQKERVDTILQKLIKDGLIKKDGSMLSI